MKIKYLLLLMLCLQMQRAICQEKIDKKLQKKLEVISTGFNGVLGIYVKNLRTGKIASLNADTLFPTASMVKVPIMVGVFDKINKGELGYEQELVFKDSLRYDNGVVGSFRDSTKITVSELMFLMESISDNTGSLWLQKIVGGSQINALMESLGLMNLRVNSRTPGRENMRNKYGWGVCTPKDMVRLFELIKNGKVVNEASSERMLRTLGNQFWDEEGLSQLPVNVKFASKTGAVNCSRSETTLVFAPHGSYLYCVVTKNQKDTSYEKNNEGFEMIRRVAGLLWDHFE